MKPNTSWKKWIGIVLALGAFAFLGLKVLGSRPSNRFLPPTLKAPDFSFPERSGKIFSSSELEGKVWVVDFIFTHCAGSCPLLSQQMKFLQQEWKGNEDFKLVTFTVDPERDPVVVLKKYAEDLQADPNQWFFLTGKKDDLYKTIRDGFKAAVEKD